MLLTTALPRLILGAGTHSSGPDMLRPMGGRADDGTDECEVLEYEQVDLEFDRKRRGCVGVGTGAVQGYLTRKKTHPPRTLL